MSGKNRVVAAPVPSDLININTDSSTSSANESKGALSNHKGKLAMGVAATLGIMVFYNWREKKLAKEDPENYARLQRLKTLVRTDAAHAKKEKAKEKPGLKRTQIKDDLEQNAELNFDSSSVASKVDA